MKRTVVILCGALLLNGGQLMAGDAPKPDVYQSSLSSVPAAELPAKAAELVKLEKGKDQAKVTARIVQAALELNPAAARAVVGAVARAVPDMAAVAAGKACELQPKQAGLIARAAAAAAPSKAAKIAAAACRAVPNDFRNIVVAVDQAAPGSAKAILEAVNLVIPEAKQSLAIYSGHIMEVPSIAGNSGPAPVSTPDSSYPMVRGPAVAPPGIPLTGTPGDANPGNGGNVPPPGRNYATP